MAHATLLVFALTLSALGSPGAHDWPHVRGPGLDGRAESARAFEGDFGLHVSWRAPLGPAYSGVCVSEGRAVTMYSDGAVDRVIALDAQDGSALWRHTLGPTYLGHDGSENGPISSPVIGEGRVYAIGPRGRLVALALADGELSWSLELERDLGAEPPEYGFTTTPLLESGVLIVQAGGSDGRLLCGLDAGSGELRWSLGKGAAAYQSPVAMDLAGRRQVVVLNGRLLLGVDPASGELLWKHELGPRDSAGSGLAMQLGEDRFCAYVSGRLVAFRISSVPDGFAVEELYRSRELGNSYATPVHHDGHVYGFKSDFLTCVDAATGRRVWKSRPPGGSGLIVVDDRLLVFGAQGVVAVARATPEGYREEARLEALEHSSFTWPSFASGRVLVRNSKELACIEIADRAGASSIPTAIASASAAVPPHEFGKFVEQVEASDVKQELIDAFLASQERFPILEGNHVHFVFQGDVEDVAVAGSMLAGGKAAMDHIEGTNFHYKTFEIEPGGRWEYRFQVDFEEWRADPLNPLTSPGQWGGPLSEVVTPGYEQAAHLDEPSTSARGRIEDFEYASEALGNARTVRVYLPAGYDGSAASYPLLIVHQGPDWLEKGRMANSLDNLIGKSVRPLVVAFVPPIERWWYEAGGTGTEEYLDMLADEFVPHLESRYRLSARPEDRALMGTANFGMTAVYGALRHADVFGKAAVQSINLGDVARHALFALLEEGPRRDVRFYIDWNRYEARDPDRAVDYAADSEKLAGALKAKGYAIAGGEALDAHGWGSWRSRTDDLLSALFGVE